ncbi:MAG: hypothetical protein QXW10_00460, partial [Candidatus Micrarchaeaceae archaeon]
MNAKTKEISFYIIIVVLAAIAIAEVIHAIEPAQYSVSVSMKASPTSNLYPYNTTYFNITVMNSGSSISSMVVGLYENGSAVKVYKVSIPHGESVSMLANYTYTANGIYAFQAIADPAHLLSMANRAEAAANITVNVSTGASPNVYESVPNSNISSTSSFTFSMQGLRSISMLASVYNTSAFDAFGPAENVLPLLFNDLYGYVAYANGATVIYENKSKANVLWLEGTISPAMVDSVLSTFSMPHSTISREGVPVSFWKANNSTSICVFYQQGWTKIISYYNDSSASTCADFAGSSYNASMSNTLIDALRQNKDLSAYQSKLIYENSTNTGSMLFYNKSSIKAMNLFQNSYGLFAGIISYNSMVSSDICYGMLYNQSNRSICSVYVLPKSGKAMASYGMINSTEASPSYSATLYSLTNQSLLIAAHESAAKLISSLNISNSMKWVSIFNNTCSFANASISCSV